MDETMDLRLAAAKGQRMAVLRVVEKGSLMVDKRDVLMAVLMAVLMVASMVEKMVV